MELAEDEAHVYAKAKWLYEVNFPEGLSPKQAYVHTGMFAGWLMEKDTVHRDFLRDAERFKRNALIDPSMRCRGALSG